MINHNQLKRGTTVMYNLYGQDLQATIEDNRNGITRMLHVNDDIGSVYIDLITHVYVAEDGSFPEPGHFGGEWEPLEISKEHKKQLSRVRGL